MKTRNKIFVASLAFIILMLSLLTMQSVLGSVGCEPYTQNVLKCWNQGTIEPITYINRSLIDMVNKIERKDWANYDAFFRIQRGETFEDYYPWDNMVANWSTDYTNYWMVHATKIYNPVGNVKARLNYTISQEKYDDYVNLTLSLETNDANGWAIWGGKIHFIRVLKDINIGSDNDTDVITYGLHNSSHGIYLNITENKLIENVYNYITIGDLDEIGQTIHWHWNDGSKRTIFLKNNYPGNADVYWMREMMNPIESERTYEMSEYWIDAPNCIFGCAPGISFRDINVRCKATGAVNTCTAGTDRNAEIYYDINHRTMLGTGTCSWGAECYAQTLDNTQTWLNNTPYKTDVYEIDHVCKERTTGYLDMQCLLDTWTPQVFSSHSFSETFNITCRKYLTSYNRIRGNFSIIPRLTVRQLGILCPVDSYAPEVDLQLPIDKDDKYEGSVDFECNASDLYPLINGSLWGNFSGLWGINESTSIYYDNPEYNTDYTIDLVPGVYSWNCQFCDSNGWCNMSMENYTLIVIKSAVEIASMRRNILVDMGGDDCNLLCEIKKFFVRL